MNDATAKLLAEVLADLACDDPDRRWHAAEGIVLLGHEAIHRAAPLLLDRLDDENMKVRVSAATALLRASPLPNEALAFVLNGLLSRRAEVRAWCCSLLGESGTPSLHVRDALDALARHDPGEDVRWRAAKAAEELVPTDARPH